MAQMKESTLISILSQAENDAAEYSGEFSRENEKYLKGYLAEKSGDFAGESPDQSSVVTTDIADVVESDMPSLVRVFLGSGDIMEFQSNTDNESEVAEAEEKTKYVNYIVRNQPDSFSIIHNWMKDAEIQKNGVVKYFIDEKKDVEEVEYTGVDGIEIQAIQESLQGADVDKVKVEVSEQQETPEQTFDIKFRVTRTTKKISIVNVPPEVFLITRNATSLDDAELVGDRIRKTRGELIAEGFKRDLIDQLPTLTDDSNKRSSNLKAIRNRDQGGANDSESIDDWASQKVEISDLYVKIDFDGDGIAERRHIMTSGNKVLINESFNHVPYASLSAILMPHKAIGRSRAEITYETQRQQTFLARGINDNIRAVLRPRHVVHPDLDLDDMLNIVDNGVIRMDDDTDVLPQNAIMPLVVPYIGDRALQVVQYVDQKRAKTTGALMSNQGLDADKLATETATKVNAINDEGEAKIELIARNYAETGFRKLMEGIAWLASRYQDTATEFRVLGKALTVNPSGWKYNHHVQSKVGLGAGSNERLVQARQAIYTIQSQLKMSGSKIVDEEGIYKNLAAMTDGLGFNRSEQLFNNPEEPGETLKAENEQLNQMVLQMQEQIQAMKNPLAEAEEIKQQAFLIKAQSDAQIKVAQLESDSQQFQATFAQQNKEFQENMARQLTELELKYGSDVPGSTV